MSSNLALLNEEPFKKIEAGTKTVELRLYDEKRRLLKTNDYIEFTNPDGKRNLTVLIEDLQVYKSFAELYKSCDKASMGYAEEDTADPDDMKKYYSDEMQKKYGVIAIKIKRIKE